MNYPLNWELGEGVKDGSVNQGRNQQADGKHNPSILKMETIFSFESKPEQAKAGTPILMCQKIQRMIY
jgi:hypothetical protein